MTSCVALQLPTDLLVYRRDAFNVDVRRPLGDDDPYLRKVREEWSTALREAYLHKPRADRVQ